MAQQWKAQMKTHEKVGAELRRKREAYGVTQTYLAKFIGCSPSTISTLERGKFGSLELVESYTWALGLDLSDLTLGRAADPVSINRAKRRAA